MLSAHLFNSPWYLLATEGSLLVLVLCFLFVFFVPAIRHWYRLNKLIANFQSSKLKNEINPDQLDSAFNVFGKADHIQHLWKEHKRTLYSTASDGAGLATVAWHATTPAESLWNGALVVDGRLKTDFFKHLPGIFTGLGIIGTFLGLISGLNQFQVSSEADVVRASLESLMHSVGKAFFISAAAITAAMLVTLIEKFLLSNLYAKADNIAQILDTRFPYSAPEDILKKTELHSEESATQLKQLKTEVVKELRPVLVELNESHTKILAQLMASLESRIEQVGHSQIDAARANNSELGSTIAQAISSGFSDPLEEIKDAVKLASGDQSQSAINMLQDVMTSFSQRLNDLFGGQIAGLNDLNQKTADSIERAVTKLNELAENIQAAGKDSTQTMAQHMAEALSKMEAQQSEMARTTLAMVAELKQLILLTNTNAQTNAETASNEMARRMAEAIEKMEERQRAIHAANGEFIAHLKALIGTSQSETNTKLQETLGNLGTQLGIMLGNFRDAQGAAAEAGQVREQANTEKTQTAIDALTGSVDKLLGQISEATTQMQASVSTLASTTTTAVHGLSNGAEQVNSATRNFNTASDNVTGAMSQASNVATRFTDTATVLVTASTALQSSVSDYSQHRAAVGQFVSELRALVEIAKTDVGISSTVIRQIEESAEKLSLAQLQTQEFLKGVATVLGESQNQFNAAVTSTLSQTNEEFHKKMSAATGLLGTTIRELDDVLSNAAALGHKN